MNSLHYQNALIGLMNGCVMPWDRDILSDSPLPSTVIDPYMSKEVPDVRESMRLTYETMIVWIDEAKKVNYFSKRFVQLSKMIMNGVTTMGRGLITLHARGEELEGVPMSIQDLIGVASYHFRKSHLGVLQTVRSHPEISERLLVNQISWNNMLMRLFKTKEKINSGARIQRPEASMEQGSRIQKTGNEDGRSQIEESASCSALPAISDSANNSKGAGLNMLPGAKESDFDPFKLFRSADRGLTEPAAICEPGAFTAPRAFSTYGMENQKSEIRNKKSCDRQQSAVSSQQPAGSDQHSAISNQTAAISAGSDQRTENEEERKTEIKNQKSERRNSVNEEVKMRMEEADSTTQKSSSKETKSETPNQSDEKHSENNSPKTVPAVNPDESCIIPSGRDNPKQSDPSAQQGYTQGSDSVSSDTWERSAEVSEIPAADIPPKDFFSEIPIEDPPPEDDMPKYLKILQNVYARSADSDGFTFTEYELAYLAADPDFARFYPSAAADIRSVLQQMGQNQPNEDGQPNVNRDS